MATLHPHINFNGNAYQAFEFYRTVFGGHFREIVRFKDIESSGVPIAPHEAEKIMHIALPIGQALLMANDVPEALGRTNELENRSKIVVYCESLEEAERIFTGLSQGANVEMPFSLSPWNSHFGMLRDQFGIEWMVEFKK